MDQMEMMTMLMQLDPKLPQYTNNSIHYDHYHEFPDTMEFSGASSTSSEISAPISSFIVHEQQQQHSMVMKQHYLSPPSQSTLSQKTNVNSVEGMREMIFRIAAMQPIQIDPVAVKMPQRKNVKISKDPQSVAARHRRERISEKIRILQRMVPGGTKMDTASMLDEAVHYVKFLKKQVQSLERAAGPNNRGVVGVEYPGTVATATSTVGNMNYCYNTSALGRANCQPAHQMVGSSMQMLR